MPFDFVHVFPIATSHNLPLGFFDPWRSVLFRR